MPVPVEGESVYAYCGIPTFPGAEWQISTAQIRRLRKVFSGIQCAQRAAVLVTKRTANNRRIPQLIKAFPDARYLNVIRDGRAVAVSLLKVHWWNEHQVWWLDRKTPAQWVREGGNPLELAAKNWVEEVGEIDRGLAGVPAGRVLEVRYEELQLEPRVTLGRMAEFLGLECKQKWLEAAASVPFAKPRQSSSKTRLEPKDQELIRSVQGPLLQRFGYIG